MEPQIRMSAAGSAAAHNSSSRNHPKLSLFNRRACGPIRGTNFDIPDQNLKFFKTLEKRVNSLTWGTIYPEYILLLLLFNYTRWH